MNRLTDEDREELARVEYATWMAQGEAFDLSWGDHLFPAVEAIIQRHIEQAKGDL